MGSYDLSISNIVSVGFGVYFPNLTIDNAYAIDAKLQQINSLDQELSFIAETWKQAIKCALSALLQLLCFSSSFGI